METKQKDPIAVELGRRGGMKTYERHGTEHVRRMGQLSGESRRRNRLAKLGKDADAPVFTIK